MTQTYWDIGKRIIEEEQDGESRAKYGKALLKNLSLELANNFGKGFSVDNLENMRNFYLVYSKSETASRKFKLSWSHYIFLTEMKETKLSPVVREIFWRKTDVPDDGRILGMDDDKAENLKKNFMYLYPLVRQFIA